MAQQRQDRRGEVQAATASATGLACFIFRFLRRPQYKTEIHCDSKEYNIYIHQSSLSTDFKSILSDSGVTYSDILNYSLAIIERKVKKIFKDYKEVLNEGFINEESKERQLINALVSVINFSYFIYSVAPKVNSTITVIPQLIPEFK